MKKKTSVVKKSRIWELDFMRGIAILLVVVDHALYDIGYGFPSWDTSGIAALERLAEIGQSYITGDLRGFWRPAFLFLFFFTSGLCTAFSRDNFFRGVKLAIVAIGISVVTYFATELSGYYFFSLFGVLHCLATIILIYALVAFLIKSLAKLINRLKKTPEDKRIERILHIAICLALGVVFLVIHLLYNVRLNSVLQDFKALETDSKILGMFFFCKNWWALTSDYFPLFPFISFFFLGAGVTRILYEKKRSLLPMLDGNWHQFCTFPGRYSLIFYLVGQVACVAGCAIINLIFTGSLF